MIQRKKQILYQHAYVSRSFIFCIILLACVFNIYEPTAHAASFKIAEGDNWHYFKGIEEPPDKWHYASFDQSRWQTGQTGFGYGNARRVFTITNPTAVTGMTLSVVCDGPFIAYLNGIEIIRTNTIQVTPPDPSTGKLLAEPLNISGFAHELMPGSNVLAVQCSNDDIDSGDFSFIPLLEVSGK
jgi:hypothetical protein